jgi:hypothetical protein
MAGLYQYRITACIVVFCRKYFGLLLRLFNGAVYMDPLLRSQWAVYWLLRDVEISLVFCRRAVYVISRCCCCLKLLEPLGYCSSVRRSAPTVCLCLRLRRLIYGAKRKSYRAVTEGGFHLSKVYIRQHIGISAIKLEDISLSGRIISKRIL